ncbi:MAG: hypothetical protein Q9220_004873 [cf. Caloplaca sp. 1 TL-2023]
MYNPSTCPDMANPNPWDLALVGHDKKRSLAPSSLAPAPALQERQDSTLTCRIIARQVFDHYYPDQHRVANTAQVRLQTGLGYVFSMSTCALVDTIKVYLNTGGGHFSVVQNVHPDATRDAVSFTVEQNGDYHVEVTFHQNIFQAGALRLYEIGPPR